MDKLQNLASLILDEAQALGAQDAQCTVAETQTREFNVDGGEFSLMRTLFDRSVSITVLKDHRKGSVHINRFDEDAVKAAIRDCIAASDSAEPDEAWEFSHEACSLSFTDGEPVCDTEALFMRTRELLFQIAERHPKIMVEQMITHHASGHSVYMNTNGVTYEETEGAYAFSIMYSAHEGEKGSSFFSSEVVVEHLDRPIIDCALIESELSAVEKQIETQSLDGKFVGTALLAPSALLEIVISTMIGNFLSDSSLIEGTSIWKDRLGTQVADPRFSMSITPDADHVVLREHHTGEGFRSEAFDLIRDGKLESFDLSAYGSNKTGFPRAKASGWNLTVKSGDTALDDLIAGMDHGILVMRFSGGAPAPSGEFSGVAKNSFLIENGKLQGALSETMISGSVPDMLMNLRGITTEVLQNGSLSVPYMAFDGVTISGQ